MDRQNIKIVLPTSQHTDAFGAALAAKAKPGDCFLLHGQIGAGKSACARAFIRSFLGQDTEVPSPTFTLVQTYEAENFDIWHADLYRLGDPQELVELGLIDALDSSVCLIEWPDLLADLSPQDAIHIHLQVRETDHLATVTCSSDWATYLGGVNLNA